MVSGDLKKQAAVVEIRTIEIPCKARGSDRVEGILRSG